MLGYIISLIACGMGYGSLFFAEDEKPFRAFFLLLSCVIILSVQAIISGMQMGQEQVVKFAFPHLQALEIITIDNEKLDALSHSEYLSLNEVSREFIDIIRKVENENKETNLE